MNIKIIKQEDVLKVIFVNNAYIINIKDGNKLAENARVHVIKNNDSNGWQFTSDWAEVPMEIVSTLVEFNIIDVYNVDGAPIPLEMLEFPDTSEFAVKRLTARDLWRRGFFIADGSRFGGDFLVYTKSPNECHSDFVVKCATSGRYTGYQSDISSIRCCNQVKKIYLISKVHRTSIPHYTICDWFRPDRF